jgi:pyruvate formate lyase activating enzyme
MIADLDAKRAADSGPYGLVARILSSSAVDGPGNRAVVFLQGCDFDCRYCHNPETRAACVHCGVCVPVCPAKTLSMRGGRVYWEASRCRDCGACIAACPHGSSPKAQTMSVGEVLSSLDRYKPFLGGITVSGGECGLQASFLEALLRRAREVSLPGLVDTNGSTDFSALPGIVAAAEGFMLDVKAWDEDEHRALVGASNRVVKDNLHFLAAADKLQEVRTVIVAEGLDAMTTVREVSRILAASPSRARYKLIRYRSHGVRSAHRDLAAPDDEAMASLAELARSMGVRDVAVV